MGGVSKGGLLRACERIVQINATSLVPSFPNKPESNDFSRLPWTPAFAGVTNGRAEGIHSQALRVR